MSDHQMDWWDSFDLSERQRDARQKLISELPATACVIRLLQALDRLASSELATKRILNDGTETITVSIQRLTFTLGVKSETTTKTYIKRATATPYLAVSEETHRPHTYLVRWLAIVDRQPVVQTSSGEMPIRDEPSAHGQVRAAARGSIGPQPGNKLAPKLTPSRGSNWPPGGDQIGPQLAPKSGGQIFPKTGLKPGIEECNLSQYPVLIPGLLRGSIDPPQTDNSRAGKCPCLCGCGRWFRQGFFRRWKDAIAARNLADPFDVEELYGIAVAEGVLEHTQKNRENVFVTAVRDWRRAKRRGAIFRENIAHTRWFGDNEEGDLAHRMMAIVDGEEADHSPAIVRERVHPDIEAARLAQDQLADDHGPEPIATNLTISDDDTARLRQQQMQALMAWGGRKQ